MARFRRPSGRALALIVGTLVVAYGAASSAAVNLMHTRAPEIALSIDGDDPVALIRKAQLDLAAGNVGTNGGDDLAATIRQSVAELPLNAPAFRLAGLASATNADIPGVRAQMALSSRIERRDAAAQLWLIEDAVQRNDVAAALRHYDTALRISESTRPVLYPVLTDAMDSAVIRKRFLPYIETQPPWLESFLRFAVSNTDQPTAIAALAKEAGGFPEGFAYSSLDRELLSRLVANEDYREAIAHFRRIDGADAETVTTLALTADSTNERYTPVTWQPFSIEGIEPFVVATGAGGVEIEADLQSGFSGPVARKLMALRPGNYTLSAKMRAEDFGMSDKADWRITCPGTERTAAIFFKEVDFADEMPVAGSFTVPGDCAVQLVTVSAATTVRTGYLKLILAEASLSSGS